MAKKIVKVAIKKYRSPNKGGTTFTWPQIWEEDRAHVVTYEDSDNLGDVVEHAIAVVDADHAAELTTDPDIVEIGIDEANEFGQLYRPQRIQVKEPESVIAMMAGIIREARPPSTDEAASLDPDDATPGVNKSKKFDIREFMQEK